MVNVQVAGLAFSGGSPLLRTKNRSFGVSASSSRCGGASAFIGRSLSTVRPGSLPGRPIRSIPVGRFSAKTTLVPKARPSVVKEVVRRKYRRLVGIVCVLERQGTNPRLCSFKNLSLHPARRRPLALLAGQHTKYRRYMARYLLSSPLGCASR